MNIWLVVTIVLSVALVVGPIMMFRPSKKDQRLAALRQSAALKGIQVRIAPLDHLRPLHTEHAVTIYSLPIKPTHGDQYSAFVLTQQAFDHEMHFSGYWDWQSREVVAHCQWHAELKAFVDSLDSSVVGVELTKHSVGVWWIEKHLTIEEIKQLLQQLKSLLILN